MPSGFACASLCVCDLKDLWPFMYETGSPGSKMLWVISSCLCAYFKTFLLTLVMSLSLYLLIHTYICMDHLVPCAWLHLDYASLSFGTDITEDAPLGGHPWEQDIIASSWRWWARPSGKCKRADSMRGWWKWNWRGYEGDPLSPQNYIKEPSGRQERVLKDNKKTDLCPHFLNCSSVASNGSMNIKQKRPLGK